jgi:hypothetical protein
VERSRVWRGPRRRAAVALTITGALLAAAPAQAFIPEGHEVVEAAAYRRLLALDEVPQADVSGRALLAALITGGVLLPPSCFGRAPDGACGADSRADTPLAWWPRLGSGAADIIIDRQLNENGQCQHFMARTEDGLTPVDPRFGVPGGLVQAYARCVGLLGTAYEGILRAPRLAAWHMVGMYAFMHAIEDSFSPAHVRRDDEGRIVYLKSWTLIDWPRYFVRGLGKFPAETHHAVSDKRDASYLRKEGRTDDGRDCATLHHPYAVPEACLSREALAAVDAITDLLVLTYRLGARAASERRTPSLDEPRDALLWEAFVRRHLPSVALAVPPPTPGKGPRPRPDIFVGALGSTEGDGWGVGAWGGRLFFRPALPFALGLLGGAEVTDRPEGHRLVASLGLSLLLPLVRRLTIGFAPATADLTCHTDFTDCTPDVGATLGQLLVPIGPAWIAALGPHWSWTARSVRGTRFALAFGWSFERPPGPTPEGPVPSWDPPAPAEVRAYRLGRLSRLVFLSTTAASTAENQTVGMGMAVFWDRDRWDRRSGLAPGLELAVASGTIEGSPGGTVALGPALRGYLLPNKLALELVPASLKTGALAGHTWGVDVAGRAGIVFLIGRLEVAVDSPPLSYLSTDRWHGTPFGVRLGLVAR